MAVQSLISDFKPFFVFVVFFSYITVVPAIRVAPNSPCEDRCTTSNSSSSTPIEPKDIVCSDDDYYSKSSGILFRECMSCLQNSTYTYKAQTDQAWFLYNLRYSFDYCIFGYPDASPMGSNPCATSEACGPMKQSFTQDMTNPTDLDAYGYCASGEPFDNCKSCVQADTTHLYLSNFLLALQAGCEQKPYPHTTIHLNDTIFSNHTITIVDPSAALLAENSPNSGGIHLSLPAIVGIAVGGFVFLCLICGCIFLQCRKRRNRKASLSRRRAVQRASSLDFRCQAHVDPFSPGFRPSTDGTGRASYDKDALFFRHEDEELSREKPYQDSPPPSNSHSSSTFANLNGVIVSQQQQQQEQEQHLQPLQPHEQRTVPRPITTNIAAPAPAVTSPRRGCSSSPSEYYQPSSPTPTSTTSQRSNTPFLSSQHQQQSSSSISRYTPKASYSTMPKTSSPLVKQSSSWDIPPPPPQTGVGNNYTGAAVPQKMKGRPQHGTPIEARNITMSFPPPPRS